jgi:hypothetical protein
LARALSRIGKARYPAWSGGEQAVNAKVMSRKRRSLVLTNEAAHHPFRASMPVAVMVPDLRPQRRGFTGSDLRDFASAFVATFVVVSVFIG